MSNKKDLYEPQHRLPTEGSVRDRDGRIWHAKSNGQWWYTDDKGHQWSQAAVSTAKLTSEYGPLMLIRPMRSAPSRDVIRG